MNAGHLHMQYGSMADCTLTIGGAIYVPWVDGFLEGFQRDFIPLNKFGIAVNALGAAV
jgi:hypothetical protein